MAIRELEDATFQVNVSSRSNKDPSVRIQLQRKGIKTRREAERIERELLKEAGRLVVERENRGASWGNLVEQWEERTHAAVLSGNFSKSTFEDYSQALRGYTKTWWPRPASEITRPDVKAVYEEILHLGKSRGTVQKLRTAINSAYSWGIDNRILKGVSEPPTVEVKISTGRVHEKKPEILSLDQIKTLLRLAKEVDHPWFPHWKMALLTGMRSGELYAVEFADINWENKTIRVDKSYNKRLARIGPTKSGCWRDIPINSDLEKFLKEMYASANGRKHILPRSRDWDQGEQARVLRTFCTLSGLPPVRFHTLRACFATQLLRSGAPPVVVMKICGWASLKTMQIYVRMAGVEIGGATDKLYLF